jgi:broad specificity phosphatase PhoE
LYQLRGLRNVKIYLVRHGQAEHSWQEADNPGLSERGHLQAAATAQQLALIIEPEVQLISSPMVRAQQTAQPLAQALGRPVSIIDAFREIPTPVPLAERQGWLKSIARQTWSEQEEMLRAWRQALLQELRQVRQPAVVFTHFMVLNAIVGALTGEDRVVCYLPDNASVTTAQWSGQDLQLLELGQQLKTVVH